MKRKDFLRSSGLAVTALGIGLPALANKQTIETIDEYSFDEFGDSVCTLVPSETEGPFPSLPSGDAMYWRTNITDAMVGVPFTFTIKLFGTNNCGVLAGYRVDVWHCNAHGYYSHYAARGANTGHSVQNNPGATNAFCKRLFDPVPPQQYRKRKSIGDRPGRKSSWNFKIANQ